MSDVGAHAGTNGKRKPLKNWINTKIVVLTTAICFSINLPGYGQASSLSEEERTHQVFTLAQKAQALKDAGQVQQCREVLEEACKLDPNRNSAAVHTTLGALFEHQLMDFDAAKSQYFSAMQFDPTKVALLYNVAICCAQMNRIDEAISFFNQYLSKDPSGKLADQAKRMLQSLKTHDKTSDNSNDPDYLVSVIGQGIGKWSAEKPIKVFVEPGDGVIGYQPVFQQIFVDAFNQWMKALNNSLSWNLVSNKGDADIVCHWVNNRSTFVQTNGAESGYTNFKLIQNPNRPGELIITAADIALYPMNADDKTPMTKDQVMSLCLHEIGHSLGLHGHSSNHNDVMFFASNFYRPSTELSVRDKATILRLYFPNESR